MNERLAAKSGRVAALLQAGLSPRQMLDELYLATLSRFPTPAESRRGVQAIEGAADRQQALEDLLWALMNSGEFFFNH